MHRARVVVLAVVALACVAVGCTSSPSPTADASANGAPPEVLDFEAPLLDGGTLRGADLAGKDVAFWFWAPW